MPSTSDAASHWDQVYRSRPVDEVSWYQAEPTMSRALIRELQPRPRSVVDVGAGASSLVDVLLADGFDDLAVLDVSAEALEVVRRRVGAAHPSVSWVVADVLEWRPLRTWDVWHDRAVFHFLTDSSAVERYVTTARHALSPGGVAVVGCFALDGPESCSGLPTARYDAAALADAFGAGFRLERSEREVHHTPGGASQPFTWVVLRRV